MHIVHIVRQILKKNEAFLLTLGSLKRCCDFLLNREPVVVVFLNAMQMNTAIIRCKERDKFKTLLCNFRLDIGPKSL